MTLKAEVYDMSDVEILNSHTEKIAVLETNVSNLKEQMGNLSDIKDAVIETKTYIKILTKAQEEQSNTLSRITETIIKQNQTLEKLNEKIDTTNERVGQLEEKFEKSEDMNKVDIRNIQKESFMTWCKKNPFATLTSGFGLLMMIAGFIKYIIPVIVELIK